MTAPNRPKPAYASKIDVVPCIYIPDPAWTVSVNNLPVSVLRRGLEFEKNERVKYFGIWRMKPNTRLLRNVLPRHVLNKVRW